MTLLSELYCIPTVLLHSFLTLHLVGDEAAPPEAARAAEPVHPLGPLGVQPAVGLLVLGLEHAHDAAVGVLHEVAAAATLNYKKKNK